MDARRKNIGLIQLVLLICLANTALCHYFPQDANNNTEKHLQHHRSRRDLESDEKICNVLDKAESVGAMFSHVEYVGAVYDTILAVTKFAIKSDYLETDCSDIPFEKIKKEMHERFDKTDEKIDRNFVAIHHLYTEIHRLFDEVTLSIQDSRIQPILSEMKSFIEGFNTYQTGIDEYFNGGNYDAVEGILEDLSDAIKPVGGEFSIQVNHIINQNFAIPEDGDDKLGILSLNALYYGVQTHVSVLLFLLEKRTLLADYYYKIRDFDNYHKQLHTMAVAYKNLKALRSKNNVTHLYNNVFGLGFRKGLGVDSTLIDRFYGTAQLAIRRIDVQRRDSNKSLKDAIHQLIDAMRKTDNEISDVFLPIINDTPVFKQIEIKNDSFKFRALGDKSQVTVKYALQYKRNSSSYYMVSDWSDAYTLGANEWAELILPAVPVGTARIIFRKISSEKRPQLVGISNNANSIRFRDVHRDLYNTAWIYETPKITASYLYYNGANITKTLDNGRISLHAAAEANNKEFATILLKWNVDINVQDDNGYTPLHLAAKHGHNDFCDFLIKNNTNGNMKTKSQGLTPLHIAYLYNQISTIKFLTKSQKINVNLGDPNGDTVLHYAVNNSQSESIVESMIASGRVNLNAKNNEGFTPLHYAVLNKAGNIVSTLLSNRTVNVNALSKYKLSPLHQAITDNSTDIVKLLLDRNDVNINIPGPKDLTPLHYAVITGNKNLVDLLIQKKANLKAQSKAGYTPLHIALTLKHIDIIYVLLSNPLQSQYVNLITKEGYTPLHMAASTFNDSAITSQLIHNGAKVNAKTRDGVTPLHLAAAHNKLYNFRALEAKGANRTEKTNKGKLIWDLAAAKGSLAVLQNIQLTSFSRWDYKNLLTTAVQHGRLEVFKYLTKQSKLSYSWDERSKFLYESIVNNHTETSKYLIDNLENESGYLLTHLGRHLVMAAKAGNLPIVKELVSKQLNPFNTMYFRFIEHSESYRKTRTPLHEAVYAGNRPMIRFLITYSRPQALKILDDVDKTVVDVAEEKGLDDIYGLFKNIFSCNSLITSSELPFINASCFDKNLGVFTNRLNIAITNDKIDVVKGLLERYADINGLDDNGNAPLHLALERKKFDFARLLMKKGPDVRIKNNKKQKPVDVAREYNAPADIISNLIQMENKQNLNDGFPM